MTECVEIARDRLARALAGDLRIRAPGGNAPNPSDRKVKPPVVVALKPSSMTR